MLDPEAPLDPAPRGSFLGHVNIVFATYALDGLLALATGALIARALGPEGRGAYALFVLSVAFAQLVLGLLQLVCSDAVASYRVELGQRRGFNRSKRHPLRHRHGNRVEIRILRGHESAADC